MPRYFSPRWPCCFLRAPRGRFPQHRVMQSELAISLSRTCTKNRVLPISKVFDGSTANCSNMAAHLGWAPLGTGQLQESTATLHAGPATAASMAKACPQTPGKCSWRQLLRDEPRCPAKGRHPPRRPSPAWLSPDPARIFWHVTELLPAMKQRAREQSRNFQRTPNALTNYGLLRPQTGRAENTEHVPLPHGGPCVGSALTEPCLCPQVAMCNEHYIHIYIYIYI